MGRFGPSASPLSQFVLRTTVKVEPGQRLAGQPKSGRPTRTAMAISCNGSFVVYGAVKENFGAQDKPCLYLRRFDEMEAKPISGTQGGIGPFLSPA